MTKLNFGKAFEYFVGFEQQHSGEDRMGDRAQDEEVNAVFAQIRTTELLANTQIALGARYNEPSEGPEATVWNLSLATIFRARCMCGDGWNVIRLPDAYQLYSAEPVSAWQSDEAGAQPECQAGIGGATTIGSSRFRGKSCRASRTSSPRTMTST
jgi:hypothetical protein